MKVFSSVSLLLILFCADACATVTVYMKDGTEVEAQVAWFMGESVYVQLQPEVRLEFSRDEVDLAKSKLPEGRRVSVAEAKRAAQKAAPRGYSELLDELVVMSGIERDLKDFFGRSELGDVNRIFSEAVSVEGAEKTMKKHFQRKLSQSCVEEVLRWYESPVGKKIVEADSVVVFNRKVEVKNFISMDKRPDFKERMGLVGQIEKTIGAAAREERILKYMVDRMIKAIPADYPDADRIKELIRSDLDEPEGFRQHFVENWAYTYRSLTLDELRAYLQFLRSANGKKYSNAMLDANEEIFKKVAGKIVQYFGEAFPL